jgi:pimeloyl-ACP methyl ester carboxylesterase
VSQVYAEGDPRYDVLERRRSAVPALQCRAWSFTGDADACNDPLTTADKERFFTSRYARKLLPGIGHFPQREDPDTVANEILAWLRS